jgi:hypothetical protein
MKFTLTFDMDNAAFEEPAAEVARILERIADKVAWEGVDDGVGGPILDVNGSRVGSWEVTDA